MVFFFSSSSHSCSHWVLVFLLPFANGRYDVKHWRTTRRTWRQAAPQGHQQIQGSSRQLRRPAICTDTHTHARLHACTPACLHMHTHAKLYETLKPGSHRPEYLLDATHCPAWNGKGSSAKRPTPAQISTSLIFVRLRDALIGGPRPYMVSLLQLLYCC